MALAGQYQYQSKFQIFELGTKQDAIVLEAQYVDENYMNFYSIKSKAEKIDGGSHQLSAYFHLCHVYRKCGNLDRLMLSNVVAMISHKILNVGYFVC